MSFSIGSLVTIKSRTRHSDELYYAWSPIGGIPAGIEADEPLYDNSTVAVPIDSIGIVLAIRDRIWGRLIYTLIGDRLIAFNALELQQL